MGVTDELVRNNEVYAARFAKGDLPGRPAKGIAIVACMDARLDPHRILGLSEGDAHLIRNAGGSVTEDALRSLVISQWLLGTTQIMLIAHTDCGMLSFSDDDLADRIAEATGVRPPFALGAFADLEGSVRAGMAAIEGSPFLLHTNVRGFVYDVTSGRLSEVGTPAGSG